MQSASGLFPPTEWGIVQAAQGNCCQSLAELCARYRGCLLAFLAAHQYDQQDREDLVHGFFECLLRREFLAKVAQENGRFRTFLITSMKNYLRDVAKHQLADKRGAGKVPVSLDESDQDHDPRLQIADTTPHPDEEYDRAWAHALLESAFFRLEDECVRAGRLGLFTAIVGVLREDPSAESYRSACGKLGMSEAALRVAAKRLRDRLYFWIREEVRRTVAHQEDMEEELRYFVSLFGRKGATSSGGPSLPEP